MEDYTPKHSNDGFFNKAKAFFTKNKKTITFASLAIIAAILLIVASIIVYNTFFSKGETYTEYKNDKYVPIETAPQGELPENPINFAEIQKRNPDVCAWIQVDGIDVIDYPIVQSAIEADDNFYLDHNVDGEKKREGSIYIQKLNRNDFNDRNTLIYGHNMLNGTMFGQLKKFRDRTFFEQNRNIYIYTPTKIMKYEIVSAFVYDDRHILNSFNFYIESECQEFFDACTNPSSITKQVVKDAELTTKDKIITLSTCTSNDSERYLVVGKLVETIKTKDSSVATETK